MTNQERLLHAVWYGTREQARDAQVAFQASADKQNAKEARWSLPHLKTVLYNEGNGRPLTPAQREQLSLLCVVGGDIAGSVQVFHKRDMRKDGKNWVPLPYAQTLYAGPLAAYWTVTLQGRTS